MATILVVDDERLFCDLLRMVLGGHGHDVIVTSTGEAALELFTARKTRLTIIDICMPGNRISFNRSWKVRRIWSSAPA
jgi:CheY-like chemotaxis protein